MILPFGLVRKLVSRLGKNKKNCYQLIIQHDFTCSEEYIVSCGIRVSVSCDFLVMSLTRILSSMWSMNTIYNRQSLPCSRGGCP